MYVYIHIYIYIYYVLHVYNTTALILLVNHILKAYVCIYTYILRHN